MRRLLPLALPAILSGCVAPFTRQVMMGNERQVAAMIESGANVNEHSGGSTPLIEAAARGNLPMVELLLKKGADPNGADMLGKTPLTWAQERGHWPVVERLKKAGGYAGSGRVAGGGLFGVLAGGAQKTPGGGWMPPQAMPEPEPQPEAKPAARRVESDVDRPSYRRALRGDDFALVVGIEKYSRLPEASFAERDAEAVKRHLEALGLPPRNIVSLQGQEATKGSLQGYLEEWLPKNVKPGSRVLFYYSGHGAPDPKSGEAYLVPWDGDAKFLQSTAYPLKRLYASLGKLKAAEVAIALDSCFSGAGGRSVLAPGTRPLVAKVSDAVPTDSRMTLLAAASGDETTATLEDQGHGIFTYFLLKGLNEGKGSAAELFQYLKPNVQDEAHRQNREQTPTMAGPDLKL